MRPRGGCSIWVIRITAATRSRATGVDWRDLSHDLVGKWKRALIDSPYRSGWTWKRRSPKTVDLWLVATIEFYKYAASRGHVPADLVAGLLVRKFVRAGAYAQRTADAGVTPTDLMALMDHKSFRTTTHYFTVGEKRKAQAQAAVAPLTYDRSGRSSPMAGGRRPLASVAVPFGMCVEPANVKAGGQGCRVRFQCSGCQFYRYDVSYLPDIDHHIFGLKADLLQARRQDAAPWTLDGMQAEADAFERLRDKMRDDLKALDQQDRALIESASDPLRKARLTDTKHRAAVLRNYATARGDGRDLAVIHDSTGPSPNGEEALHPKADPIARSVGCLVNDDKDGAS